MVIDMSKINHTMFRNIVDAHLPYLTIHSLRKKNICNIEMKIIK